MKRLDTFILSKFLQLFAAAFFVCLFVFMMQFTWRYIDDLVGKGLTLDILAQFFGYMSLTLVPQSLPLAILLASLMTFGNMGENLELLSMKAAGVPLTRVMRPLIIFSIIIAGTSFYFQNDTAPNAQKSLRTLLLSMRQSQPAVEIPEGIFYNGVPKVNIYVDKKVPSTGMLYQVIIYKTDQGVEKAQIVLADSGRLEMTADKLHIRLGLWSGTQFQNLQGDNNMQNLRATMPYDRETFTYKEFLIDFDSNFNLLDGDKLSNIPSAKNMTEIVHDADSMSAKLDSAALEYVTMFQKRQLARRTSLTKEDSVRLEKEVKAHPANFDDILAKASNDKRQRAVSMAKVSVQNMQNELTWKNDMTQDEEKYIRRHWIEWHTKITLSLACLLFFFIGAPLGAIIRKGGLGMPTIISVAIFIVYYIINTSGMKMAREGNINMVVGMWTSTFILTPAGIYLTFMADRDSQVFNLDAYRNFFRKLFGIRVKRNLTRKEVIIAAPDYDAALQTIPLLRQDFGQLRVSRLRLVNFFRYRKGTALAEPVSRYEALVEELSNTRDLHVLQALNLLPYVTKRHLRNDRRKILKGLSRLERAILALQGKEQRRKAAVQAAEEAAQATASAQGATQPVQAASNTPTTEKPAEIAAAEAKAKMRERILQTPVVIGISDRTEYDNAMSAVAALTTEAGRIKLSKWGLINTLRYRSGTTKARLEKQTQLVADAYSSSTDLVIIELLTGLPLHSKQKMQVYLPQLIDSLTCLSMRTKVILEHQAHTSSDSYLEAFMPPAAEQPTEASVPEPDIINLYEDEEDDTPIPFLDEEDENKSQKHE